jgi:UDP-glucose 4-epimerase
VVDDLSRGHAHNVAPERLRMVTLSDTGGLVRVLSEGFDAVIHFAAFIAVGESARDPLLYFSNNVSGTLSLLRAMQTASVKRLVFSSTAAVYGMPERIPITESQPFAPVNPYGESKVAVERILGWLDECLAFRSVSLRYFNACGADAEAGLGEEHEPETHLIPLIFRAIRTGQPITVFGEDYDTPDGTCIRDYIHVVDLAEAHVAALESLLGGAPSNAFNVGTGSGHSVREVIRAAEEVTGRTVPWTVGPRREGDPPVLVADSRKLQGHLNWKPRNADLRQIRESAWAFDQRKHAAGTNVQSGP